ncbi:MAG: Hsp20/alpha crystallin family protein [Deltaproteobacteria bacterium]|nr:Hsp20/alpha crystallin family protein [Deltaproteobacteria bacterium]
MGLLQRLNPNTQVSEWDPFRMMREMMSATPWGTNYPMFSGTEKRVDTFVPGFDVKENKEGYIIKADLPGVNEADLEVTFQGNQLRIAGKREQEKEDKGDTWYSLERSYGAFTRVFTLPDVADTDKAKAELKNGVLHLFVPRQAQSKTTRVEVKTDKK